MGLARLVPAAWEPLMRAAELMLVQARDGHWDEVAASAHTVMQLSRRIDPCAPLFGAVDPEDEARRVRALTHLIRIDAEVRQLRDPGAQVLDALLDAGRDAPARVEASFFQASAETS